MIYNWCVNQDNAIDLGPFYWSRRRTAFSVQRDTTVERACCGASTKSVASLNRLQSAYLDE